MESKQKALYKICRLSACLVALCTVSFVLSLLFTWDFSEWTNIESFKNTFKPIQMLSVIPSILLAISYVTFVSGLHIYASGNKKIWSQMTLSFGLIYAGISIANYLIQLLTVIPSVQNEQAVGLTLLVSGYPNSLFFALMASYFLMCISLLFSAFVFENKEKTQKWIYRLFLCASLAIPLFIIGAVFNIPELMGCGAICWIVGTTVGMLLTAHFFKYNEKA